MIRQKYKLLMHLVDRTKESTAEGKWEVLSTPVLPDIYAGSDAARLAIKQIILMSRLKGGDVFVAVYSIPERKMKQILRKCNYRNVLRSAKRIYSWDSSLEDDNIHIANLHRKKNGHVDAIYAYSSGKTVVKSLTGDPSGPEKLQFLGTSPAFYRVAK